MVYLKSLFTGLLVAIAACATLVMLGILAAVVYMLTHRASGDASLGWDPISLIEHPSLPLILFVIVCFAAGCIWEYRKLTHSSMT